VDKSELWPLHWNTMHGLNTCLRQVRPTEKRQRGFCYATIQVTQVCAPMRLKQNLDEVLPHLLYSGNITLSPFRSFWSQPPRVSLRGWCGTVECRVPVSALEGGQLTDREYTFFFKCERRLLTNMATILQITCLQQWYASFVKLLYVWNGNNIK